MNSSLIITPMLDVAFQLLAFFIMTYHPSAFEGHVDGELLPMKASGPSKLQAPQADPPPDIRDDLEAVLVRVPAVARGQIEGDRSEGQPSRFEVQGLTDAGQPRVVGGPPLPLDEALQALERELRTLRQAAGGRAALKLEGDPNVRHQYVMRVYDVCKSAGFEKIHFVAPK